MWGALSDERMGLSFTMYNIFTFYMLLHECIKGKDIPVTGRGGP
jgi:hypothetical protein